MMTLRGSRVERDWNAFRALPAFISKFVIIGHFIVPLLSRQTLFFRSFSFCFFVEWSIKCHFISFFFIPRFLWDLSLEPLGSFWFPPQFLFLVLISFHPHARFCGVPFYVFITIPSNSPWNFSGAWFRKKNIFLWMCGLFILCFGIDFRSKL